MPKDSRAWYQYEIEDQDKAGRAVVDAHRAILDNQSDVIDDDYKNAKRYNKKICDVLPSSGSDVSNNKNRLKYNITSAVIDSFVSLIGANVPRIEWLSDGGSYQDKKDSLNLTRISDGFKRKLKLTSKAVDLARCIGIWGSGFLKIVESEDDLVLENVIKPELVIDKSDALYNSPRTLYHHQESDRDFLLSRYEDEEARSKIKASSLLPGLDKNYQRVTQVSDPVGLLEAWHLPSYRGATDGRHIISCGGGGLLYEPWDDMEYPGAWMHLDQLPTGFFGRGLSEQLKDLQTELNVVLWRKQRELSLSSVKILLNAQTKLKEESISNDDFAGMRYSGPKPEVVQFGAYLSQLDPHIADIVDKAYQITGISMMYSGARKEPGVTSGIAIENLFNVQTQRFAHIEEQWKNFWVDFQERLIRRLYELDKKRKKPLRVYSINKGYINPVSLRDVEFVEDKFVAQAFPVNPLTKTPSGKLDYIEKVAPMLGLNPDEVAELLDFPDVERFSSRKFARVRIAEMIEEAIYEDKDVPEPDPMYMPLDFVVVQLQSALCKAVVDGVEPEILDRFSDWITQAKDILSPPAPPVEPAPPGAGAPGPGMPPGSAPPGGEPPGMMLGEPPPEMPLPPDVPQPQGPMP